MDKVFDTELYSTYKIVDTVDGQRIFVNSNDQYIGRDLINKGFWEKHVRDLFRLIVKENMCVIDIGANIGAHTLVLSKLVGDGGKVYTFEPFSVNYEILKCSLLMNSCYNTIVYKHGVGENRSKMFVSNRWLNTKVSSNFGAINLDSLKENKDDEEVDIISLDELELKKVDLIKIDAEGMEDKVLAGMVKLIETCRPYLVIEIHDGDYERVSRIIRDFKYELKNIYDYEYNGRSWDYFGYPLERKDEIESRFLTT